MKKLLVIADNVDEEQFALNKAISLAKLTVAQVHVVAFCYESLSFSDDQNERDKVKGMIISRAQQAWGNYFTKHQYGESVNYEVVWEKNIDDWVKEKCKYMHYDLIVKSGNRSEAIFHTPTDWRLFRQSEVPVYSVSTNNKNDSLGKSILVALDFMTKNKSKSALNEKLLESAFQLSVQTNSRLYICSCINIPVLLKDLELIDVYNRVKTIQKKIEAKATLLFDKYDIPMDDLMIKEGVPWKIINYYAEKINASCVVVGSMGRKGIAEKLIGNTAEKVIHHTKSDLLLVPNV
jgi:universal stress protein E